MSSAKLVDTEPGGESTQYESIKTIEKPTAKETGQFQDADTRPTDVEKQKDPRGEQTAEDIRYGQGISESRLGGMTTDPQIGTKEDDGTRSRESEEKLQSARHKQGYGPGSDVGA